MNRTAGARYRALKHMNERRVHRDSRLIQALLPRNGEAARGRDLFRVLPRENRELLDLSTNGPLMQTLAERSDGKLYTPENVEEIRERLARRVERTEHRDEVAIAALYLAQAVERCERRIARGFERGPFCREFRRPVGEPRADSL